MLHNIQLLLSTNYSTIDTHKDMFLLLLFRINIKLSNEQYIIIIQYSYGGYEAHKKVLSAVCMVKSKQSPKMI